jgi:hypothetical protein
MLGTISYAPPDEVRPLRVGEKLPPLSLEDLRQGQQVMLEQVAKRVMIIFTGRCPSCSLALYLKSYSSLEPQMQDVAQSPLLIFSSDFSGREIIEGTAQLNIQADLYLARGGIPGIEDEYYRRSYFSDDVLVITTDSTGTVTNIQSLEEAFKEMKGDHDGERS